MADNNYCACNSGESKYTIKLNQQGPAGKKGEQGDKGIPGFSPYISVVQSDNENYILRINNEANSYNTPNLFPKDQLVTWTNNIEAQVNQNTTDLSKINGNYVDLNTGQEISGRKHFTNEETEFSTGEESGKVIIKSEYDLGQIRFNSTKRTDGYYNGAFIAFSNTYNKLYYKGNTSSQGVFYNSAQELAVKGDLIQYDARLDSLESTVGEQAQTIATLQENNTQLLGMINTLKDRVTALETMIDGGNA